MTEPRIPADAEVRAQALDPARSFIVQAPAGSGKTEILIRRLLALLARVDAPEEIVALTFTRKAAGEMRARVLAALARAADDAPPEDPHERETWVLARAARARDAACKWSLALHPVRLRVLTIDGLCALLVRRMPLLSRLGGAPAVLDDASELYRDAARATLALLDDGDDAQSDAVARLLLHLDNRGGQAEALLVRMLARRDQWIRHVAGGSTAQPRVELERALAVVRLDAFARVRALAAPVERELVRIAAGCAARLDADRESSSISACAGLDALPAADEQGAPAWLGLAELLLTSDGGWRKTANVKQGFLPQSEARDAAEKQLRKQALGDFKALMADCADIDGFAEALHALRRLPPARYDDAQWAVLGSVIDVLRLAAAQLQLVFAARGAVDYPAVAQAALAALGSEEAPTDLLLALDARIRHLLVDEFQDTSVSQFELLVRLTAGWSDGDGRTLFVVGDPMQSIYRFREAEVGLFLRARQTGIGRLRLQPLALTTNFRSVRGVVDWVNLVFAEVFPAAEDIARGAVPFAAATHWKPAGGGEAVTLHAFAGGEDGEPQRVADLIAAARAAASVPEMAVPEIAVLVRGRGHLADIVPRLRAASVPLRAVEIESLAERPVVQDLLALTRALVHPADRIAWLAVLRAPWCGLALGDLHALCGDARDAVLWDLMTDDARATRLAADGRARLAHAVRALRPAIDGARRAPLRAMVEGAWLRLAGPDCTREPRDLDDARAFLDLLADEEQGADLASRARLEQRVAQLFAAPAPLPPGCVPVDVMTIHKAKGLEFDVVIVPRLGRRPRVGEPQLLAWSEQPGTTGGTDLLLGAIAAAGADEDPVHAYVTRLQRERERLEAARLLYVAATRAKSRLHLLGSVGVDADGVMKTPPKDALLAVLWPVVRPAFEAVLASAPAAAVPGAPAPDIDRSLRRLPVAALRDPERIPLPPVPVQVDSAVAAAREPLPEFSWAGETVRHVGTVVHRWLQKMSLDLARWDEARLRAARNAIGRELATLGVPAPEREAALARTLAALLGTLGDARGRWALGPQREAASELRLTGVDGGAMVDVAIDRTFVDDQGVRWVIDYKTGSHEGGAREAFLDRERERYRPQLERYARLLRAWESTPSPVRCGLYFPLLGGWREWAAE